MGLRISELAERVDVPVSTVRYYERIGLLRAPQRQSNGYRVYDESAAEHLAFIGRAKRVGMPLEQVAELIELWSSGGCRPMQEQIREFLAGRVSEVRAQRQELAAFTGQLQRLLDRIDGTGSEDRLCELDCGCVHLDEADPLAECARFPTVARDAGTGCSLPGDDRAARRAAWGELMGSGHVVERWETGLLITWPPSAATAERVAGLCAAEAGCCPFFAFVVEIGSGGLQLRVGIPPEAEARALLEQVFGVGPCPLD